MWTPISYVTLYKTVLYICILQILTSVATEV